jgi:hypothetical protein
MAIHEEKPNAFLGQFAHGFDAAMHGATVIVGDRLGLYSVADVREAANDPLEGKLNAVGRMYFSALTFICTPASCAQEVGRCPGGVTQFQRATQTPFNLIDEARP